MAVLDKQDIQGNILYGYRLPSVLHVFSSIRDHQIGEWKRFLAALGTRLTLAEERVPADSAKITHNIGLSYEGLAKLYPHDRAALELRFHAYVRGMPDRSNDFGDPSGAHWDTWRERHVWITLYGQNRSQLESHLKELDERAPGLELGKDKLWGHAIVRGQQRFEHFGFRDGIVSPAIDGAYDVGESDDVRAVGNGKVDEQGNWLPIAAGEFILGHPNERGELVLADLPADLRALFENGTFAVFRDLEQHVTEFLDYVAEENRKNSREDVAEKIMGRTRAGDPLARPGYEKDFTYNDDPGGARCPVGAHIRRANPRKPGLGLHRLIRRGMPYTGAPNAPDRRGLYFVAMNASIENQFEFLQKAWINGPTGGLSASTDPVGSSRGVRRKMLIEGSGGQAPILLLDIPKFVTCHGGQYYFMPGRRALGLLATPAATDNRAANGSRRAAEGASYR
jgi:Dyp-type peroxidase family